MVEDGRQQFGSSSTNCVCSHCCVCSYCCVRAAVRAANSNTGGLTRGAAGNVDSCNTFSPMSSRSACSWLVTGASVPQPGIVLSSGSKPRCKKMASASSRQKCKLNVSPYFSNGLFRSKFSISNQLITLRALISIMFHHVVHVCPHAALLFWNVAC